MNNRTPVASVHGATRRPGTKKTVAPAALITACSASSRVASSAMLLSKPVLAALWWSRDVLSVQLEKEG